MARYTSEKAAEMVGNKFDLVLIASARARELKRGYIAKVAGGYVQNVRGTNGPIVTALREIEEGHVGREYLKKIFAR